MNNEENSGVLPIENEENETDQLQEEVAPVVEDAPAVDDSVLTDIDLLALIATNLDDIKKILITLVFIYVVFNVVRWSK